ncbi:MAG: hypothetical protein ACI8Q6_002448 [Granulosicoccus sp.]|jgi:hypothetical protein
MRSSGLFNQFTNVLVLKYHGGVIEFLLFWMSGRHIPPYLLKLRPTFSPPLKVLRQRRIGAGQLRQSPNQ